MRKSRSAWPLAAAVIALGGPAALGWHTFGGAPVKAADPAPTAMSAPPAAVIDLQNAFTNVADGVRPAVVSITSRMTVRPSAGTPDLDFGQFGPGGPEGPGFRMAPPVPRTAVGTGSGFIVRNDGWILTNDHVVGGADSVTVRLDDGREFKGDVKRDPRSDLAVVKIDASNLPTLQLADSTAVKVGQWAIAFGSPFGLEDTMTVGIVSALGRESAIGGRGQDEARFYPNLIQTDASINPGNSGGPLLDINGHVMGVNVAIGSPTGGNVGIGFAIPANTASYVMEQLITKGAVTRGYLGFAPANLSPADQTRYGVKDGALVAMVEEGSPAAKAGLQVEDVVTAVNGKPIRNSLDLRDAIARATPGQPIQLTVFRSGKEQTLNATVGEIPGANKTAEAPAAPTQGRLGVQVADLTPEIAKQLNMPEGTKGVVVGGVQPGSPAFEAGLRQGDVLLRINGKDVKAASDVSDMVKAIPAGGDASMVVMRGKSRMLLRTNVP
jgi:serine protease Do